MKQGKPEGLPVFLVPSVVYAAKHANRSQRSLIIGLSPNLPVSRAMREVIFGWRPCAAVVEAPREKLPHFRRVERYESLQGGDG